MPLEMRRTVELPERRVTGQITSAVISPSTDKRTGKSYDYLNLTVLVDTQDWSEDENNAAEGFNGSVKISVNANLTKNTDLGRLLARLNMSVPIGQKFDEKRLEGLRIAFDMKREGNFVNPVVDSVSLVE